ncbi:MAG: nucleotidyltransferase domain-containing protein [Nitrospira sp.]|nr:nucleotidyltransferase domain-containing protein [Nitrospira sp.]
MVQLMAADLTFHFSPKPPRNDRTNLSCLLPMERLYRPKDYRPGTFMQGAQHQILSLVEQKAREVAFTVLAEETRVHLFVFGSHASGSASPRSDIDVGIDIGHVIAPEKLAALREAFDELPILQKVDVVDFCGLEESFKSVARQHTMTLYDRQAA